MSEKSCSIKVDIEAFNKIKDFYSDFIIPSSGDYVDFVAKLETVTVTGYSSNKSKRTISFKGESSLEEARIWNPELEIENKEKEELHYVDIDEQIGSDEVGVGDF